MYRAPRGTSDIRPDEQLYWRYVAEEAARAAGRYGYERIDTPTFEEAGLFVRSVGETTDIVEKQMYVFQDRDGNEMTLRPEGTAPVCRAYLEHGMANLPQPVKLFYLCPIFRYERPQAGRFREHHQFGCEAIGEDDPALDAEVISLANNFFNSIGLRKVSLQLNSIGCRQCRPVYLDALKAYYAACRGDLCADCQNRMVRNPLRLLDCKKEGCSALAMAAPKSVDYLCPECRAHFDALRKYLGLIDLDFTLNHCLVRGLDYYTKTVFEFQPEAEGAQSAVGGGGRYDNLIEELGGKPTPAIGFATGLERVIMNLKREQIVIPPVPKPQVYIVYLGNEGKDKAVEVAATLRQANIGVAQSFGEKSLKAQLRQANTLGARYAVIIGAQEVAEGTVVLRDMESAQQQSIPLGQLRQRLQLA